MSDQNPPNGQFNRRRLIVLVVVIFVVVLAFLVGRYSGRTTYIQPVGPAQARGSDSVGIPPDSLPH